VSQSDGWSVGCSVSWSIGELVGGQLVGWWSDGWSDLLCNNQHWSDAFLAEWGVDFDSFIGGKKDYKAAVVGVVVFVSVFVKREAGGDATAREGGQERRNAMRKGWRNERGGRDKRWAARSESQ